MADVYEQNLPQKTNLTTNDYVRVVGSDDVSYKQPLSDVAQKTIENYAGSTLAGSTQSVKGAIDGLKSQDTNLQAQINQLVAPTGTAPNPAEIENARIGADNITYTTLGDAIRTQVTDLKSEYDYITRTLSTHKVAQPLDEYNQPTDGTDGQSLRTKGDGTTEWADVGLPTDAQTAQAVSDWLDEHPEATTTVQDHSLTYQKLVNGTLGFVIPEMYGAKGDGVTDDSVALQSAIDSNKPVFLPNSYYSSKELKVKGMIYGGSLTFASGLTNCISNYDNESDIVISKVKINANGSTNALLFIASDQLVVESCEITNFSFGIIARGCDNTRICNNVIHDGVYYGIMLQPYNGEVSKSHVISQNELFNIKDTSTPSASADGQGIVIYGQTETAPYLYVEDISISNNRIVDAGRNGIALIGAKNATVSENICSHNKINTKSTGIAVSEACYGIVINGNICNDNVDGITIDVATQTEGEASLFGNVVVEANVCLDNSECGIRNENANYLSIIGNRIENTSYGIFTHQNAMDTIISNNAIRNTTLNGIRLIGLASAYDSQHTNKVIIANNNLHECGGSTVADASIYIGYYDSITVIGNIAYRASGRTLSLEDSKNNIFKNNKWYNVLLIGDSNCFNQWDDDISAVTHIYSPAYGGNLRDFVWVDSNANKIIPLFGLDTIYIGANVENFVCSETQAIATSYVGKKIKIIVMNGSFIIKHGGNVSNIGGADVTIHTREAVEYVYRSNLWIQIQ